MQTQHAKGGPAASQVLEAPRAPVPAAEQAGAGGRERLREQHPAAHCRSRPHRGRPHHRLTSKRRMKTKKKFQNPTKIVNPIEILNDELRPPLPHLKRTFQVFLLARLSGVGVRGTRIVIAGLDRVP